MRLDGHGAFLRLVHLVLVRTITKDLLRTFGPGLPRIPLPRQRRDEFLQVPHVVELALTTSPGSERVLATLGFDGAEEARGFARQFRWNRAAGGGRGSRRGRGRVVVAAAHGSIVILELIDLVASSFVASAFAAGSGRAGSGRLGDGRLFRLQLVPASDERAWDLFLGGRRRCKVVSDLRGCVKGDEGRRGDVATMTCWDKSAGSVVVVVIIRAHGLRDQGIDGRDGRSRGRAGAGLFASWG